MSTLLKSKDYLFPVGIESFLDQIHEMDVAAWRSVNRDYSFRKKLSDDCYDLVRRAHAPGAEGMCSKKIIHEILEIIYDREFSTPDITNTECNTEPILRDVASIFEQSVINDEIDLASNHIEEYPSDGDEYVFWLKALIARHGASNHQYYSSYLPRHGTSDDIKYLLAQETSLDPRFDDILALIQLGARGEEKMELAANYWDEMGNGNIYHMHSVLFAQALGELAITDQYIQENYLLEAKVCGNLSAAFAFSRRHYYKAIGYFGVTEYLAPRRFRSLVSAWRRLGLSSKGLQYHELHVSVDAGHAAGWFRNVIRPVVDRDSRIGRDIAIGALVRLNTSARYLDALMSRAVSLNDSSQT
ncbi:iron-containing redox enzyme family protein [Burkholderia sp. Bp8998]|uniref:iron-containing redox enzyme family protein n=1 Tax=Burkholderia sp. Bp8998 TaxID=2184557 RepID=UPI000F5B58B2|nr:iron-containing redox enzyme family protein [Burkholderia sp. Bp8998]RQS14481.1 iron-containing redox enzyme family protein [Burkholderia sp. Bp8998]